MIRDLEKRLRKLESNLPPPERSEEEKSKSDLALFLMYAVGYYFGDPKPYYFGDPKPNEPPVAAYARALGYEHQGKLQDALKNKASGRNDPEFDERDARASRRLFAKFGVNLKSANGRKFSKALKRIHAGLSESYKERLATPS
jgi:hypothetical protein